MWLASVTDSQCMVVGPKLWPATGQSCRYLCPCPCRKTGPVFPPARRGSKAHRSGQIDLFAAI